MTEFRTLVLGSVSSGVEISKCCAFCLLHLQERFRCSVCKSVYYCSEVCQLKDWKKHKLNCGAPIGAKPERNQELANMFVDFLIKVQKDCISEILLSSGRSKFDATVAYGETDIATIEKFVKGEVVKPFLPPTQEPLETLSMAKPIMEKTIVDLRDFFWLGVAVLDDKKDVFLQTVFPCPLTTEKGYSCSLLKTGVTLDVAKAVISSPKLVEEARTRLETRKTVDIFVKINGCIFCDKPNADELHYHQLCEVSL